MLKYIKINNFFLFDLDQELILDGKNHLMIKGELAGMPNRSNGSGKSSVMEALYWCFTGKTVRETTSGGVIRWGEKQCSVDVGFVFKGDSVRIVREYGKTKSFSFSVNDEKLRDFHDSKQGTNEFFKFLGIDISLFDYLCIYSRNFTNFSTLKPKARAELISGLLDIGRWNDASDRSKKNVRSLKIEADKLESNKSIHHTLISDTEAKVTNTLKELSGREGYISNQRVSLNNKLTECNASLVRANEDKSACDKKIKDTSDITVYYNKCSRYSATKTRVQNIISSLVSKGNEFNPVITELANKNRHLLADSVHVLSSHHSSRITKADKLLASIRNKIDYINMADTGGSDIKTLQTTNDSLLTESHSLVEQANNNTCDYCGSELHDKDKVVNLSNKAQSKLDLITKNEITINELVNKQGITLKELNTKKIVRLNVHTDKINRCIGLLNDSVVNQKDILGNYGTSFDASATHASLCGHYMTIPSSITDNIKVVDSNNLTILATEKDDERNKVVYSRKIKRYEAVLDRLDSYRTNLDALYKKQVEYKATLESELSALVQACSDRLDDVNNTRESISRLGNDSELVRLKQHLTTLKASIDDATNKMKAEELSIVDNHKRSAVYDEWFTGFKAISYELFTSILGRMEELLTYYLKVQCLNFKDLSIDSQKTQSTGNIVPEIVINIIKEQGTASSGCLSEGESRRFDLACFFTLSELISSYYDIDLGFFFIDEPSANIDVDGKEGIFELLLSMDNKQMIVIDHDSSIQDRFADVAVVVNTNGVSKICQQ